MWSRQFEAVGRELFQRGLVASHSGNISVRLGDRLVITRRSCRLGSLSEQDLVETGVDRNDRNTPLAPPELEIHRAIYRLTPATAIIHAHPPYAVALSLTEAEIVPSDGEGAILFHRVPVLAWRGGVGQKRMGRDIAQALRQERVVLVCGHGSYAIGQLMEEAYQRTTALEGSCQILCILKSLAKEKGSPASLGAPLSFSPKV